ncbi:MAG: hypothetical protein E6I59_16705 [Chloroflexi bacterium]|nr:MAG: hypothetical protein AUI01_04670 [Ktedonobacter sp. 13_2_20CM_2_56_8]TME59344.1 MAG: hypothetical protein E6I59_16705 [Chloroflexota bacterium]
MEEYQLRLFKTEIANQCQSVLSAEDDLERYFQTIDQLGQQLLQEAARSDCDPSRLFDLKNQFPEVGRVWKDISSLLTAAANISKHLWPLEQDIRKNSRNKDGAEYLRKHLEIDNNSPLNPYITPSVREMRNNFEHYDSRLEEFARQGGTYIDSNIGPIGEISGLRENASSLPQRHFDQKQWAVIFQNQTLLLRPVIDAVRSLAQKVQIFQLPNYPQQ